jgi:dihydrodipicolinate reductase
MFMQVVLKLVLPRIILPQVIEIARAEAKANIDKLLSKAQHRKPTKRETSEMWERRSQRLAGIPQALLVKSNAASSLRHTSTSAYTVYSFPGGEVERQRWIQAKESGVFADEADVLELWQLFHPPGTTIHVYKFVPSHLTM